MRFSLVKFNKRLYICDNGEHIYSPPDFLRHRIFSRDQLNRMVDQMNETGDVFEAVWEFETSFYVGSLKAERKRFQEYEKRSPRSVQYVGR